jgi:signal transduction histidine kinase/ActR/RegA family two-component response regulator
MSADAEVIRAAIIRAEPHVTVGELIQRDAAIVIERWARRAAEEQTQAKRVHHDALLDHLPTFLEALGRSLAESGAAETSQHRPAAGRHGAQRWETGWSLREVVRDYQILRLVLVQYLEESLNRPLTSREAMAVGLALDEAIAASVNAYVREREERSRQADEALRQQAERLQEADRRKDEFLAVLAHELRNPLAPLGNAVQVLGLQGSDPATVEWVRGLLDRQVRHMTRLVEDLLDVSRISRGKIILRRERLDLARLVREAVEDRLASITDAGLLLSVDLPPGPVWVDGDSTRLDQVVGNLLQNAMKFTEQGGAISVRLAVEEGGGGAAVTVHDTGVGIEAALLTRVFDTFMQADRSLERSRGGLGLGLALVKGLVGLHGGEVQAASAGVGRGAEFTVRLPLAAEAAPPAETLAQPRPAARSLRILLIEDDRDSAESLKLLLELYGHHARFTLTGPEGVAAARQQPPDVVLCDLSLPGMSGYAVAAALRAEPALAATRLIAVSGHGSDADQQRCREAGFDLHVTKPVDPTLLQELLAALPPRPEQPPS